MEPTGARADNVGAEGGVAAPVGTAPAGSVAEHGWSLLRAALRDPEGPFRHRWTGSAARGRDAYDLNALLPLTLAWAGRDAAVARDLVLAALDTQQPDGSLPRALDARGEAVRPGAPWPLVAQAAEKAWQAEPSGAFLAAVLPSLARYMDWALAHFGSGPHHLPRWPSAEDAFIPDIWEESLLTVDLAVFLVREIEAIVFLAEQRTDVPVRTHALREKQRQLTDRLQAFLWDPDTAIYRDRFADGRFAARHTLSAETPLLLASLPPAARDGLLARLDSDSRLLDEFGLPLWEAWGEDPLPAPVPPAHQAILLEAYRTGAGPERTERLRTTLKARIARLWETQGALPAALGEDAGGSDDEAARVCTAALAVRVEDPLAAADEVAKRPWERWIEGRTRAFAAGAGALLLLFIVAVIVFHSTRRNLPVSSVEAMVGLARSYYQRGEYDEAIRIYRDILAGGGPPALHLLLGNALFQAGRYADAAEQYREALEGDESGPLVQFNLAQALCRQGRIEEGRRTFEEFIAQHDRDYPEVAERARTALSLVRESLEVPGLPDLIELPSP